MKAHRSVWVEETEEPVESISASLDTYGSSHIPETVPLGSGAYGDVDLQAPDGAPSKKVCELREDLGAVGQFCTFARWSLGTLVKCHFDHVGMHATGQSKMGDL